MTTITDATPGAVIYYTTNGANPTASSTPYTGAISVSTATTVKAIAVLSGYSNSTVASAAYTIKPSATTPTITPHRWNRPYRSSPRDHCRCRYRRGPLIYYTTNGRHPNQRFH